MSNHYFTGPPRLIDPAPFFLRGFFWGFGVGVALTTFVTLVLR